MEEIIEIDSENRLVVEQDVYPDSPLEWGWGVHVYPVENHWGNWEIRFTQGEPLARLFNEIESRLGSAEKVQRAMHLYQVYTNDDRAFKFVDIGVYRDRYTYLVIGEDADMVDAMIGVFEAYITGEVYIVAHQQRKLWVHGDDTMETWETVHVIGGCYLDDEYTAEQVAQEYFNIEA